MSTIIGPTGKGRDEEVGLLIKAINELTELWLSKPSTDQPMLMFQLTQLFGRLETIYPYIYGVSGAK